MTVLCLSHVMVAKALNFMVLVKLGKGTGWYSDMNNLCIIDEFNKINF